jgi:PPPDE putative peptidase domain
MARSSKHHNNDDEKEAEVRNDAKWSKPQPPPSNKSVSQSNHQTDRPQPPSVGTGANSNWKGFVFDEEDIDVGPVSSGKDLNNKIIKGFGAHHRKKKDRYQNKHDESVMQGNEEVTKQSIISNKRPSTATPQVAQVQKPKHHTAPLNKEKDDSDIPPPPPPPRSQSSPMSSRTRQNGQSSTSSKCRTASQQHGQFDDASQSDMSGKGGRATNLQNGQFDDASENHRQEQFEDASEAPPTDLPYGQFEDASEFISTRRAQRCGQFDDASEPPPKYSSIGGPSSLREGDDDRTQPQHSPPTSNQPERFLTTSKSISSSQRKSNMNLAKAGLLRDALTRVRSRTSDKKNPKDDENRSRGSSTVVSIGSLSPFRKKLTRAVPNSPANDTQYSGSTITSASGTGRTGSSRARSERSVPAIEGVVSNADTEKTRNLSSQILKTNKTNKSKRVPRIPRHAVGKQREENESSRSSSVQSSSDKNRQHSSSSSSYSDDEHEYERRSERSLRNHKSRHIKAERRQSDGTGSSSMTGSTALTPLSMIPKSNRIRLHVYDLVSRDTRLELWGCHFPLGQCFNAVNSSLHSIGTGAYHVGVEVNGVEYAYGANSTKGLTGVFTCMPKSSPGYQYRTTIDFGDRRIPTHSSSNKNEFPRHVDGREVVRAMAAQYMGTDYDLLRKNCCTFAHDACIRLGIDEKDIPSWFHNLAATGAMTQDAANSTLAPISSVFSSCELDAFANYINENAFENGFEVIGGSSGKECGDQIIDSTH